MSAKNLKSLAAPLLGVALVLTLAGCEMSVNKGDANGKKGVEINTPFGDLRVKNQADARDTGLPVYPGATPKPSEHASGDDKGGNVSLSVLSMKLVVLSWPSPSQNSSSPNARPRLWTLPPWIWPTMMSFALGSFCMTKAPVSVCVPEPAVKLVRLTSSVRGCSEWGV